MNTIGKGLIALTIALKLSRTSFSEVGNYNPNAEEAGQTAPTGGCD